MTAFYYVATDENGVLCIDQLDTCNTRKWNHEKVAALADDHPETLYFEICTT